LMRSQHAMFLLADMMTWCEVGAAFCAKAAHYDGKERSSEFMKAAVRIFARDVAEKVFFNGLRITHGCCVTMDETAARLKALDMSQIFRGDLDDRDRVTEELVQS